MNEKYTRIVQGIGTWEDLRQFELNAKERNLLTPEISASIQLKALDLSSKLVAEKTGLDLDVLSPAETKIVQAVSEYVGVMKRQGKYPQRTFEQLKNRGLIGAAEVAVAKSKPTQGFQALVDADLEDFSFEQIVLEHPEEFSARAKWFSRRTLGLTNGTETPPAEADGDTQSRTTALIQWLKAEAAGNDGVIPEFSNTDAAEVMGFDDMQRYGQVHGNIQSRIDFACFLQSLPPLGLAAEAPFAKAWGVPSGTDWVFPVAAMQHAAKARAWTDTEFNSILRSTELLPGQAHLSWKDAFATHESKIRDWALGFQDLDSGQDFAAAVGKVVKRNPAWSRDELILALDLYLKHRLSPPAKDSAEVNELSEFLNRLGSALSREESATYRNSNGVYMKMMNFMGLDPQYTTDGKVGLTRGNKDEKVVWNEYALDPVRLASVVAAIRMAVNTHGNDHELAGPDEPDIAEAEEGRVLTRMHRYRERSRKLVDAAKAAAMKKYGRLACEACGFEFKLAYGPLAEGIIDVHHTKPVHTLTEGDKTKVEDLALLCANCHRVVHSSRQWLSVQKLRELIQVK
jgi:predicted HNH restriction endonuclease